MTSCKGINKTDQFPGSDYCVNNCGTEMKRCLMFNPKIQFCYCRNHEGCCISTEYNSLQSTDTVVCPESCQCVEEMMWNDHTPPKPNCKWLSNFSELRRQWSDHARQQKCKCCNCRQRYEHIL